MNKLLALIKAAESGDREAMIKLIGIVSMSKDLSNDTLASKKRNEYVEKLANIGDPVGFILMGDRFKTGNNIEKSIEKAIANYYLAANSGDTFGYELIAQMHIEGDELPINYELAYSYLKKSEAANNGKLRSDLGYFFMGEIYYFGLSIPQDWKIAKKYYLKVIQYYAAGDFYRRACDRISTISTFDLESGLSEY
jgi:TPR repeat protein